MADDVRTEFKEVKDQLMINNAKVDWLQHSIYWGFALFVIIILLASKKFTAISETLCL